MVFDATWNTADLGWRENMPVENLVSKFVLHWNGKRKAWNPDGLYKEIWQPHCDRFSDFLRTPVEDGLSAESTKEHAARLQCPTVNHEEQCRKHIERYGLSWFFLTFFG